MSKKIVVILGSEPEWGGEHRYATTLMECVERTDDDVEFMAVCGNWYWRKWCSRHKIRILNIAWPSLTEKQQKWHLNHPFWSRVYVMYGTGFGKILRKEKIDAVLCTTQGTFVPNLNRRVIVPVHDLMHRYEGRFPEVRKGYEEREVFFSSKAKYAWCVLVDSQTGKRQFTECYSSYMRKKLPHVISLPFAVPNYIMECEEEFIDTPMKYVFYPAQFWKHKNHINLIQAINLLKEDIPDVHLILVGSEKNSGKDIKQYILDHGLGDYVTIKGFVSNGNIVYLYRHAVGLIMPTYFGPTNIPPLEAMALGCPVAVSNKYAMHEQVGDAGLLFNPDSPDEIAACIRKLWMDESLRREMIRAGHLQVRKWTGDSFNKKFQRIVKRALD